MSAKYLIGKLAVIEGLVTQRLASEGELALPGVPVLKIASLDSLTLTVYVPETELGRLRVGQRATIRVDSFTDESFEGQVTHIASEAQFTPKNVQTKEERVNTVFGVEIEIPNPAHRLKPGMPADAAIEVAS